MTRKECETCVSRRKCGKGYNCSLGILKWLREDEKCGTFQMGSPMEDYEFEYNGIHIDEINEMWLEGKDI